MALRDSTGRWQENSFMQKWTKACTFVKQITGKAWPEISFGLGFNTTKCPISAVKIYVFNIFLFYLFINYYKYIINYSKTVPTCIYFIT